MMSTRDEFRATVKARIKSLERKSRRKVSKTSAKIIEESAKRHAVLMKRLVDR